MTVLITSGIVSLITRCLLKSKRMQTKDWYEIIVIFDHLKTRIAVLIIILNGIFFIFTLIYSSVEIFKGQNGPFIALWIILIILLIFSTFDIFLWPHCRRITSILIKNPFDINVLNHNKYIKNDKIKKPLLEL